MLFEAEHRQETVTRANHRSDGSIRTILNHGYTDTNKGDAAIALGTIAMIRRILPDSEISSHSIYSEKRTGFATHSAVTRRAGVPVIEGVLPSPYLDDDGSGVPATGLAEDLSPAELSTFYGQCDVVLATRLRTVILAACAGTPAVAISNQGFKTQGIMRSLNLERYTHDISSVSSAAITTSLVDVLSRQAELRAGIANRVEENRRAIARSAEMILGPFRRSPAEGGESLANAGELDAHSSAHP